MSRRDDVKFVMLFVLLVGGLIWRLTKPFEDPKAAEEKGEGERRHSEL